MSKKQAPSVRLLNELMRTRDFQALLDLARPTFGNPMILSNGSYSVIAITDEPESLVRPELRQDRPEPDA